MNAVLMMLALFAALISTLPAPTNDAENTGAQILAKATEAFDAHRRTTAVQLFTLALTHPLSEMEEAEARLFRARTYRSMNQTQHALEDYDRLMVMVETKCDAERRKLFLERARAYCDAENFIEAQGLFAQYTRAHPHDSRGIIDRLDCMRKHRRSKAFEYASTLEMDSAPNSLMI